MYNVFVAEGCIPEEDYISEMQDTSDRVSKQVKIYLRRFVLPLSQNVQSNFTITREICLASSPQFPMSRHRMLTTTFCALDVQKSRVLHHDSTKTRDGFRAKFEL